MDVLELSTMSLRIKDYMTKDVKTIDQETTVTETSKVMTADPNYQGYVIILFKGKPIGIVTERDIIHKIVAEERDPTKTKSSDIMSTPLITIDPDEDLLMASKLMQQHNVRKLAVVRDEIIYGVITAKNIAQQCSNYVEKSIKDIITWTPHFGI
jgi:CBS domain-containing protein